MTRRHLLTLLVIVIGGGITIAFLLAPKNDGNLNSEPMYGHALFGGSGLSPAAGDYANSHTETPPEQPGITFPVRANLIVVGQNIFFDENNNRQPEASERFLDQGNQFEVTSSDGLSIYRLTKASLGLDYEFASNDMPQSVILHVDILSRDQPESVTLQQSGKINVFPEPANHGWAHFGGPLSMELIGENVKLPATGGPTVELRMAVFTPSVECNPNAEGKALRSNPTTLVPNLIFPTATIEFPSDTHEPIVRRYELDQFC